jgi:hypothetical protein
LLAVLCVLQPAVLLMPPGQKQWRTRTSRWAAACGTSVGTNRNTDTGAGQTTHSSFERGAVDRECRPNGGWECEAVHKLITLAADRVHVLTWGCSKSTADRVHVHT